MLPMLLATAALLHLAAPTVPVIASTPNTVSARFAVRTGENEHLLKARQALDSGDFDSARREYVLAAALDRDAGRLPVEATFGLVHVLYAQSYTRDAAIVLNKFAREASTAGDANAEARALADAIWLNNQSKQFTQARADASRLRTLLKSNALTPETRRHVESRVS